MGTFSSTSSDRPNRWRAARDLVDAKLRLTMGTERRARRVVLKTRIPAPTWSYTVGQFYKHVSYGTLLLILAEHVYSAGWLGVAADYTMSLIKAMI